jgi:Uma2 family endonuclease
MRAWHHSGGIAGGPHVSDVSKSTPWTYEDYLGLPEDGKRYEIIDGELFVSPNPKSPHQHAVTVLSALLYQYLSQHAIGISFAPSPDVVLTRSTVVQPDLAFLSNARRSLLRDGSIHGAPDLVVEVASPSTRRHDRTVKRRLYARMGVTEYWIVDPRTREIEIFVLEDGKFRTSVVFDEGEATSLCALPGFSVPLDAIFALEVDHDDDDDTPTCAEGEPPFSMDEFPPSRPCTWRDYWRQPDDGKRWEILRGKFVLLPTPWTLHQAVVGRLLVAFWRASKEERRGDVSFRLATVLAEDTVVDPDVLFVSRERRSIIQELGVFGAPDLLVEVIHEPTRERDSVTKLALYGECGVREYWLVDPDRRRVDVFTFAAGRVATQTSFTSGEATSPLVLPDFRVPLEPLFEDDVLR